MGSGRHVAPDVVREEEGQMSEVYLIRRASSAWLRRNEIQAHRRLADARYEGVSDWAVLSATFPWSDYQVNNMLTYLAMVDE